MVTRSGYVKRLPVEEFEAQSRGGRGKAGAKLSAQKGDAVAHFFSCNDHDALLFITNRYGERERGGRGEEGKRERERGEERDNSILPICCLLLIAHCMCNLHCLAKGFWPWCCYITT